MSRAQTKAKDTDTGTGTDKNTDMVPNTSVGASVQERKASLFHNLSSNMISSSSSSSSPTIHAQSVNDLRKRWEHNNDDGQHNIVKNSVPILNSDSDSYCDCDSESCLNQLPPTRVTPTGTAATTTTASSSPVRRSMKRLSVRNTHLRQQQMEQARLAMQPSNAAITSSDSSNQHIVHRGYLTAYPRCNDGKSHKWTSRFAVLRQDTFALYLYTSAAAHASGEAEIDIMPLATGIRLFAVRVEPPPIWNTHQPACVRCNSSFGVVRWKHHCRNCGESVCSKCSSKRIILPQYQYHTPVRVCDLCYGISLARLAQLHLNCKHVRAASMRVEAAAAVELESPDTVDDGNESCDELELELPSISDDTVPDNGAHVLVTDTGNIVDSDSDSDSDSDDGSEMTWNGFEVDPEASALVERRQHTFRFQLPLCKETHVFAVKTADREQWLSASSDLERSVWLTAFRRLARSMVRSTDVGARLNASFGRTTDDATLARPRVLSAHTTAATSTSVSSPYTPVPDTSSPDQCVNSGSLRFLERAAVDRPARITDWSVDDVVSWLHEIGLVQHTVRFVAGNIDGHALVHLRPHKLRWMSAQHRRKLFSSLSECIRTTIDKSRNVATDVVLSDRAATQALADAKAKTETATKSSSKSNSNSGSGTEQDSFLTNSNAADDGPPGLVFPTLDHSSGRYRYDIATVIHRSTIPRDRNSKTRQGLPTFFEADFSSPMQSVQEQVTSPRQQIISTSIDAGPAVDTIDPSSDTNATAQTMTSDTTCQARSNTGAIGTGHILAPRHSLIGCHDVDLAPQSEVAYWDPDHLRFRVGLVSCRIDDEHYDIITDSDGETRRFSVGDIMPFRSTRFEYRIGKIIGSGTYGRVYEGLNMEDGSAIAIKVMKIASLNPEAAAISTAGDDHADAVDVSHIAADHKRHNYSFDAGNNDGIDDCDSNGMNTNTCDDLATTVKRAKIGEFAPEILLMQLLDHPNIIKFLGTRVIRSRICIFMELASYSLSSIVKSYGGLPENVVSKYVFQILLGLRYLHQCGIVHRDIKASNILVSTSGIVKLADFGVSKRLHDIFDTTGGSRKKTNLQTMIGSPFWMAPEVVTQAGYGRSVDVWSLGCTVVELLTGAHPWSPLNQLAAVFQIAKGAAPPLPNDLSPMCRSFLEQCMQTDPVCRPTTSALLKHPFVTWQLCSTNHALSSTATHTTFASYNSGFLDTAYTGSLSHSTSTMARSDIIDPPGHANPAAADSSNGSHNGYFRVLQHEDCSSELR
jgi:serine/threonine protein kinase